MTTNPKGPAPDIVLTDGALRAASWREDGEYGPFWNTKITRRYQNVDGDVRETSSLRERDLLPAAELTAEIRREILERKREHSQRRTHEHMPSQSDAPEPEDYSEDWHDENMTEKDIRRKRFMDKRKAQDQSQSLQHGPSQES
ncbi:MAG: hypothetical protein QNI84_17120 [Henriciella sp.]|nr:hypothetical protein [Henriciella sp.]